MTHVFLNDRGNQEVKETYNKSVPSDDVALFSGYIADFAQKMATYAGSVMDPEEYGKQMASRLCPITLPYELGTAAAFDLAGLNGRPLGHGGRARAGRMAGAVAWPTAPRANTASAPAAAPTH